MGKAIPTYDICTIKHDRFASDDILISRFASYLQVRETLHKPHRHKFYHLVFFTKGSGNHTIDFVNFPVKPGEMYFMIPGQVHSWNFKSAPDGYIVNFSEHFFRSFLFDHRFLERFYFFSGDAADGVVFLSAKHQKEMTLLFEKILDAQTGKKEFAEDMTKLLLLQVFILAAESNTRKAAVNPAPANHPVLRNFQSLVDERYLQLRMPKDYAALLFVTPNYLNNLCVKFIGTPAGEIIRNRVLLEAKRLLVNDDLTISQIADRLNFTDHSHFSKFFKKSTTQSPEDFRKKLVENTK